MAKIINSKGNLEDEINQSIAKLFNAMETKLLGRKEVQKAVKAKLIERS